MPGGADALPGLLDGADADFHSGGQGGTDHGRDGLVLTCKDKLVNYYAKFGFVNEGKSENSQHGGVSWNQMRLTF